MALSLFTLYGFSARALDSVIEWDEDVSRTTSPREMEMIQLASQAILQSPLAREHQDQRTFIIVTFTDSPWFRSMVSAASEFDMEAMDTSLTFQREVNGNKVLGVAVFWDRIMKSEEPLSSLIGTLARDVLGTLNLPRPSDNELAKPTLENQVLILRNLLRFFWGLPHEPVYRLLNPNVRISLEEDVVYLKGMLREALKDAREQGVCAALLSSQDH